ncbi:hypothetical protein POM88_017491 [Heracleum sosnowskyi]|uniref:E2 ubiquitin-conjugating enzyme n=1 Tax=Heracleum sosnowskyi TaxID=360622 RepID=A0AAD8MZE7_9APIA|nr:hypothetical protein POM88_017491 [Heracleum sosnowskyi]
MKPNPRISRRNMESPSTANSVPGKLTKKNVATGKSTKKVFSEESSMDLHVVEKSQPPVTRSKSKALKLMEVSNKEMIDGDLDEKHGNMNIAGKVDNKYNGKRNATDLGTPSNSSFKRQRNATDLGTPSASSSGRKKSTPPKHAHEDEILKNFEQFKKFDVVKDPSDHHYVTHGSSVNRPSKSWSKKIQEEWKILEKDLPDAIFVRVYESRMDILRAVIVGAEGTPYHDGLFFFDVFFPNNYPNVPPQVHYWSHGLRLNPNLYECGNVCLSLLNTWSGSQEERWNPKLSTMLQVLVSVQGLILNAKPYFNEPGYESQSRTLEGEKSSQQYNESTFILSLKTMVFTLRKQPKHFEEFILGHFFKHAREILVACKAYMDGAQVGCLVSGGVQDVKEDKRRT